MRYFKTSYTNEGVDCVLLHNNDQDNNPDMDFIRGYILGIKPNATIGDYAEITETEYKHMLETLEDA